MKVGLQSRDDGLMPFLEIHQPEVLMESFGNPPSLEMMVL